jgi:hypothetical protein
MWGGRTSGTPPTSVETTVNPQQAASNIAMQKDSVNEVFKNIWPLESVFLTSEWWSSPRISTLSCNCYIFTISLNICNLDPPPPIKN